MEIKELTEKARKVRDLYMKEYPKVKVDRDYFPFKLTEELGECIQAYLMYTDRGRQKGKDKKEIREIFEKELADVFGFLLLFAEHEKIDLEEALDKKWFEYLRAGKSTKPA